MTSTSAEAGKFIDWSCFGLFHSTSYDLTALHVLVYSYDSTLEDIADGATDEIKEICGDDIGCLIDGNTMGAEAALGFIEDELDEGSDDDDFDEDDDNTDASDDDENEDPEDTENKDRSEAANLVDELADGAADCVVDADHPDASDKDATYWEVARNRKCPYKSDDRLFEIENVNNIKQCYRKCKNTDDCVNFSVGMHEGNRKCMGCVAQDLTGFHKHDGFTAYELTPKGAENKKISKNCPDKEDKQEKVGDAVDKAQKKRNKGGRCKATGWGDPQ